MNKAKTNLQLTAPPCVQDSCLEDIYIPQAFREKPDKRMVEQSGIDQKDKEPITNDQTQE